MTVQGHMIIAEHRALEPERVCALIEMPFRAAQPLSAVLQDNLARIRRQCDALGMEEVTGLGGIAPGASLLLVRADVIFELSALEALCGRIGYAAQIGDKLAAVHVDAGDAAAALSKFRREETTGWAPFRVKFLRLEAFDAPSPRGRRLAWGKQKLLAVKAARLPSGDTTAAQQVLSSAWSATPGLESWLRLPVLLRAQKKLSDAGVLSPAQWRWIGLLLLCGMVGCGVSGYLWAGALAGLLGAACFDIAERATDFLALSLSNTLSALCIQTLITAAFWLFVVAAGRQGDSAAIAMLVLLVLPLAFVLRQAVSGQKTALFGVYMQGLLASGSALTLGYPLVSASLAAIGFACAGLALALALVSLLKETVVNRIFDAAASS